MERCLLCSFADCSVGFDGLLADVIGNVREFALIRLHGREVFRLADEVKRAKRLPHLLVRGINGGEKSSLFHLLARLSGKCVEAAGNG